MQRDPGPGHRARLTCGTGPGPTAPAPDSRGAGSGGVTTPLHDCHILEDAESTAGQPTNKKFLKTASWNLFLN